MKKSALSLLLSSLLFAGAYPTIAADSKVMEKNISVNVQQEKDSGSEISINLDGTHYAVNLSQAAVDDPEVRQHEIAHLPAEVQQIVSNLFEKDKSFAFSFATGDAGEEFQIIKKLVGDTMDEVHFDKEHKIIITSGDDADANWVTSGDANVMVLSDLHEKSSTDGERRVMVIKTEFEGEGDIGVADLIISLIKSKPLSDSDKQKIRDALN